MGKAMTRREFPTSVRREALKRAKGHCEATGSWYGLPAGTRCNGSLAYGVEFDHAIADSIGGEPTLANCVCVCLKCHRIKSAKVDTPRAAKTKRQSDKHLGTWKPKSRPMDGSRGSKFKKHMDGSVSIR